MATRPEPGGESLARPGDLARAGAERREHLSPPLDSVSWSFSWPPSWTAAAGLTPHALPHHKAPIARIHFPESGSLRQRIPREPLSRNFLGFSCPNRAGGVGQGPRRLIDPQAEAPTAGRNAGLLRDGAADGPR